MLLVYTARLKLSGVTEGRSRRLKTTPRMDGGGGSPGIDAIIPGSDFEHNEKKQDVRTGTKI